MILKIFLLLIGIFVIILYTFPLIETKLNIGNIFGISVGAVLIVTAFLFNKLKNLIVFKVLAIAFIICIFIFLAIMLYIILKSKKTATEEKTIIVLGCRVKWDKPSLSLIERCRVASDYMKQNEGAVAILSGGQGADEKISEAECMLGLMTSFGIDESRLFIENKSTSTEENLLFSRRIIEENNLSNGVAIATSEYHEARALLIARRKGFKAKALPCKTLSRVKAPFYTREVFGLVYEILRKF